MASEAWTWLATNRGPIYVLLSQIISAFINLSVKVLITKFTHPISPFSILNARMIITLCVSSIYCWIGNVEEFPAGPMEVRWLMLLRAAGGSCGAIGFYFSLKYLPLAEATVLNLLAPVASCIACAILLKGTVSKLRILAATMSVVAVIIIARPALIFHHLFEEGLDTSESTVEWDKMLAGIPFALLGAAGGATAYTCLRLIGTRVHPLISMNYFSVMMICVTNIAILRENSPSTFEFAQVLLIFGVGIANFLAESLITTGLAIERSSSSTLMIISQVPFATVLDWVVLGISPNLTSVLGGVILLVSLGAILIQQDTDTSDGKPSKDGHGSTAGPYFWMRRRRTVGNLHSADLETYSLESLLPSDEATDIDIS